MRSRLLALCLSTLAVSAGALGATPSAQCFTPDGLTGSCCSPVTPNLPAFPPRFESGLGVCWNACIPDITTPLRVTLGAPATTGCTQYTTPISVFDGGTGSTLLTGSVVLDYTRNWNEATVPPFGDKEVWRFAAKADLSPPAGTTPSTTCPVPSCLFGHPTAFFYGYVDYAFDCTTAQWSSAVVLYHACDWFIHNQAFSDKPGTFHPGTSYGIIAPNDPGNPFAPGTLTPPAGPLVAEAVRDARSSAFGFCTSEEFVSAGVLNSLANICVCPFTPTPAQHTAQTFSGVGSCPGVATGTPSSWTALNTIGFGLPWLYMMTTSLGSWTTGASYPGPEQAFVNEGLVFYHDACREIPGATLGNSFDVVYGATTVGGYTPIPTPVGFVTDKFVDVASNFSLPLGTPPVPPFVGSVRPTDHLIYVNVP